MTHHAGLLILDDDDGLRESLAEVFAGEGYRIYPANRGQRALEIISCGWVQCGILDVNLPDVTGLSVVRQALRLHPGFRAILTSAAGTPNLRGAALESGAYFFLDKPFRLGPMIGLVARAVRGDSRPELPAPPYPL